jgi:hypothetical protein
MYLLPIAKMFSESVLGLFVILCCVFPFVAMTQPDTHQISNSEIIPRPKVFVIGLSRTGTTSLGDALELLSYRRTGWEDIRSRFLFRAYSRHDLSFLIDRTFNFDAFEDLPWSLVYKEMASLYSDAKFILTLRKSEDAWLKSIKRHTKCRKWDGHETIYGAEEATGHEGVYLDAYRNHTDSVREFFALPGRESRLLEFVIDQPDVSKGERWSRLCEFLGISDSKAMMMRQLEFPWSNAKSHPKDDTAVRRAMAKMKCLMEEGLVEVLYGLGWLTASGL